MESKIRRSINREYSTILVGILRLVGLLSLCKDHDRTSLCGKRGRPYTYAVSVMIRCYIVRIWLRIPSNNALHYYFSTQTAHSQKIMRACSLHQLPDRRTFDRRFKVLPATGMICAMGNRFVSERLTDSMTVSVDSAMIHAARMRVWHKSHRILGIVPHTGIDTDAKWGKSKSKGWVYGYKLHMSCSTGVLPVPLSAEFTTANIQDNQVYHCLVEGLPHGMIEYVAADLGYDDSLLYEYSARELGVQLVCPIRAKPHTKGHRLEIAKLYNSELGHGIYRRRSTSIEPLFEIIKNAFSLYMMPVRGHDSAQTWTLMCVLVYQLAVYWNCIMTNSDRPRRVKRMLGN